MNKQLRFCMITTFYPPYNFGGEGIFVYRLSNELARLGHHVEVIHCIDSYRLLSDNSLPNNYENRPNVKVHGLRSRYGFLSPLSTQLTGSPLLKSERIAEILERRFDVIHYHNISLVGGPRILKYGDGIKLLTIHDYWLVCPTHVLFKFNRAACENPQCVLCILSYKRPVQLWRYLGLINDSINYVDRLVSPSLFAIETHKQFGLKAPFFHLPHFVPAGEADSSKEKNIMDGATEKPFFLFLGRLEKLKGLHTIIPLFREYKKAQLFIAGKGKYENYLKELAAGSSNIVFHGFLTDGEKEKYLKRAIAVVVPSLCYEISSLVVLEAFIHKVPVIARKIGALKEILESSGGGGILYETEGELLRALDHMVDDKLSRDKMGLNAYEAYKNEYTVEKHLDRYFDLIKRIAATNDKGRQRV
jgi:glycosyltransferase involved in cell wall biosynthesis